MRISFTILGPPRTKKTSNRIVRCGKFAKILPSSAFEEWNKVAQVRLRERQNIRVDGEIGIVLPYAAPVNCRALIYRDALRGDAVGYYQAIADALEEAGIVTNDKLILQWDGSRLLKDKENPRVEIVLETVA